MRSDDTHRSHFLQCVGVPTIEKNWNDHVADAEEIARSPGFVDLRDRIIELAEPASGDVVVDVGSGTGLLSLALAPRVSRVWAIDIAPAMTEYLRAKAASADLQNVDAVTASAVSLPLVEASADLLVSNYCFHHLSDGEKQRALAEAHRVLRPGGRLVFGDMMFRVGIHDARDRKVVKDKIRAMLRRGLPGVIRLAKNAIRFAGRRGEQPAPAEWWESALERAGFEQVETQVLAHEGGVARARRR
jgi:ubiquinone/menaquinone biosynthesis C-methylase UbiE